MSRFRVLVVDDEPLARQTLVDLLGADAEVEVIGECSDGERALDDIRRLRPDIVLLDIEMPERGGLDVIRALGLRKCCVALSPASMSSGRGPFHGHAPSARGAASLRVRHRLRRYATRAFEVEALDYVLKPFSDERLAAALARAKRRVREQRVGELATQFVALSSELGEGAAGKDPAATSYLTRLSVEQGGRARLVPAAQIRWIEAEGYYVRLHTKDASHLLRASLAALEERLDPGRFLRIHRKPWSTSTR